MSHAVTSLDEMRGRDRDWSMLTMVRCCSLQEGFAVPEAVLVRSAVPAAGGRELKPTMEAVSAVAAASADFDVHPTGAASWCDAGRSPPTSEIWRT